MCFSLVVPIMENIFSFFFFIEGMVLIALLIIVLFSLSCFLLNCCIVL